MPNKAPCSRFRSCSTEKTSSCRSSKPAPSRPAQAFRRWLFAASSLRLRGRPRNVAYSRLKDREITKEITQEVYTTLIAALDREDIESLSNTLYKIPKTADKFQARFRDSPDFARTVDFSAQLSLLDQATDALVQLVQSLTGMKLERVKALNDSLHEIEAQADKHMAALYKDLFSGKYSASQAIVLKDLYELLEKLIDRCRDSGNIIAHIVLKNA